MIMRLIGLTLLATVCLAGQAVRADSITVAVAANFLRPMTTLVVEFGSEHDINLISGSTGGLYAQIVNGAPYDIFVAADRERPRLLGQNGIGVEASRFTIARGELVLWSAVRELPVSVELDVQLTDDVRFLAIANPDLAPYGEAARQTLVALGLWDGFAGRLVNGTSIAQAYALASTGNAELGFVARSQVTGPESAGSYVPVPSHLYEPIDQDAILLTRGADNAGAIALFEFLSSDRAKTLTQDAGFGSPD